MWASFRGMASDESMATHVSVARSSFASRAAGQSDEACRQMERAMESRKLAAGEVAMEFYDGRVRALPDFAGVVVSDRYVNYFHESWEHFAGNQACLAH